MSTQPSDIQPIAATVIRGVAARLAEQRGVRQRLPGGGMLNMDRPLPFLCVYRRDPGRSDVGTELFVQAEAAYLSAPGLAERRRGLRQLVRQIAETISGQLGSFLIVELWSADDREVPQEVDELTGESLLPAPFFRILTRTPHHAEGTVAKLEYELQRLRVHGRKARVEIDLRARNHPPRMGQLLSAAEAERLNCHLLGLEIRPIYRAARSGELYIAVLRRMRRAVTRALKQAFFQFALNRTTVRPQHYFVLGRKTLPQQVWSVDRQLADVSSQFKFLLLLTPVNAQRAWYTFVENQYAKEPKFQYRPLETDPLLLKRRLYAIRTERVEDPTLAHLMRQKQDELDRQITMLADISTRRFLPGSLQVFGDVEPGLLELAREILRQIPHRQDDRPDQVTAQVFARRVAAEIRYYRQRLPTFTARALVRDDMYTGLLSTGGNLLIGRGTTLDVRRVDALLQHEVGTHLITYYNGAVQPFKLLRVGLAGYDGLQEGLAVVSEYLVGGLSRGRMRTLAARVLVTDQSIRGASFVDSYRLLTAQHGFEPHAAFTICVRVYRAGGLTKDAIYLRGLVEILDYLRHGGDLEPLFVGKLAADHIPVVRELLLRQVLRAPPLHPRWTTEPAATARLEKLQTGMTVLDLLEA